MGNRQLDTINALLSAPRPIEDEKPRQSRRTAGSNDNGEQNSVSHAHGTPDSDLDDTDLEAFEMKPGAPLVKPRRRRQVSYQTVRINKPTAQVLRAQWLIARRIDPLFSFTEFSTIVVQRGLQALANERELDSDE